MANKEATARIKINKLLEAAGWRFFADGTKPANIRLEASVTIKSSGLESLGENFEKTSKGFQKKIQATLSRVWGEEEPALEEA